MWKWIIFALVGIGAGILVYDYFRQGLHTMPELPDGAFFVSYKNGMRAIMVDVPDYRPKRKYMSTTFKVEPWYEDAWSFCRAPFEEETASAKDIGTGSRLEAVCFIDDGDTKVPRGLVYSVPNL